MRPKLLPVHSVCASSKASQAVMVNTGCQHRWALSAWVGRGPRCSLPQGPLRQQCQYSPGSQDTAGPWRGREARPSSVHGIQAGMVPWSWMIRPISACLILAGEGPLAFCFLFWLSNSNPHSRSIEEVLPSICHLKPACNLKPSCKSRKQALTSKKSTDLLSEVFS